MKCRLKKYLYKTWILFFIITLGGSMAQATMDPHFFNTHPQGYHPGSINYWDAPYFANGLAINSLGWVDQNNKVLWRSFPEQLDVNGYPKYLQSGQIIRAILGQNMTPANHPSTWPDRSILLAGQITLTWTGLADVRCAGTFVSSKSDCAEEGPFNGGTRVYLIPEGSRPTVTLRDMDSNNPVTDVKCWLPDPADPQNKSLVNQLFHPAFIDLVTSRKWGWIRMMQWGETNGNPQKNWEDRRRPTHCNQNGVISRRDPSEGTTFWTDHEGIIHRPADRPTGCSYEYMIALCNETDQNLWINIPHLATDDFVTKLAQLIKYGSNGVEPYDRVQSNPTWAPLKSELKVFVENSNEVWMGYQWEFPQGDWSRIHAENLGITKPQFTARQSAKFWTIFEGVMGTEKVVRLAAAWNSIEAYTLPFLDELDALSMSPDVIAGTTYFGNGIQFWVDANPDINLPVSETPWISSYWTSQELEEDLTATFKKWNQLILGGLKNEGNTGADEVSRRGGIGPYLNQVCVDRGIPLVAYEGGPDLYTKARKVDGSWLDSDDSSDNAITLFIEEFNRRDEMYDLYYIHMNQAFERGLNANVGFTDISSWGRNGQWGHIEYLGQPLLDAPKFQLLMDTFDEFKSIRSINNPQGAVPIFQTNAELPFTIKGQSYSQTITASANDGGLQFNVIGSHLPAGLSYNPTTHVLSGTPQEKGRGYLYLRILDVDNDPAWRTFTFNVIDPADQGPSALIRFENLPLGEIPSQYDDPSGYTFTANESLFRVIEGTDGNALMNKNWSHSITLSATHPNGYFHLTSFDYGSQLDNRPMLDMTVTAYFINGSTTSIELFSDSKTLTTEVPTGWDYLEKVVFNYAGGTTGASGVIDNINLDGKTTPESKTITLNFNHLTDGNCGTVLTEQGFTIKALRFAGWDDQIVALSGGFESPVIRPKNWSGRITLTKGGEPFTIQSFQHGAITSQSWGNQQDVIVTAEGYTTGYLTHTGTDPLATKEIHWENVTEVTFNWYGGANNNYGVLDNIVVSTGTDSGILIQETTTSGWDPYGATVKLEDLNGLPSTITVQRSLKGQNSWATLAAYDQFTLPSWVTTAYYVRDTTALHTVYYDYRIYNP